MILSPPLVTAVVPTYNAAAVLRECLESLVAQDYENLEILVMDGGSKDETVAIARSFGTQVRVITEPDEGIYDAMNKGIAASTGEWLYFMGADDALVDPFVLSDMMSSEAAQDETTLLLYGDVRGDLLGEKYPGELTPEKLVAGNICHQSIFYRRRRFDIEAPYQIRYRLYADWDLNLRVFLRHPGTFRYVDRLVATFTGGLSTSRDDQAFWSERLHRIWDDAVLGHGKPFAKNLLTPHYLATMNEVRKRGDWARLGSLFAESLRRSHVVTGFVPAAFRRIRKKPLY